MLYNKIRIQRKEKMENNSSENMNNGAQEGGVSVTGRGNQNAEQSNSNSAQEVNNGQDMGNTSSMNSTNQNSGDLKGKAVNKHIFVWVGAFLFGGLGVDRFLRGQIGLGVVKLLFGWLTLGIWSLVDFIIAVVKAYGGAYKDSEDIYFDGAGNYTR